MRKMIIAVALTVTLIVGCMSTSNPDKSYERSMALLDLISKLNSVVVTVIETTEIQNNTMKIVHTLITDHYALIRELQDRVTALENKR